MPHDGRRAHWPPSRFTLQIMLHGAIPVGDAQPCLRPLPSRMDVQSVLFSGLEKRDVRRRPPYYFYFGWAAPSLH